MDELHADISLAVTEKDELVIGAGKVIVIDSTSRIISRFPKQGYYLGQPFLEKNKGLQFHFRGTDSLLNYNNGSFSKRKLTVHGKSLSNGAVLKFFTIGQNMFAIDLREKALYSYNSNSGTLNQIPTNQAFERSASIRLYETSGKLWVAGSIPGLVLLDSPLIGKKTSAIYKDFFISDVYQDHEGNFLLSTFDKGVLVVQDLTISDVINSFRDDPVTSLHSDDRDLLMGTSKGYLMQYANNRLDTLNNKGDRPIEGIYSLQNSRYAIFDNGYVRAYDKIEKKTLEIVEASLKDIAFLSPASFYLGTNRGVIKVEGKNGKFNTKLLHALNQRIYALEYDSVGHLLYASTSEGLKVLHHDSIEKPITFKSEAIYPLDLKVHAGILYIPTSKHGLLQLKCGDTLPLATGENAKQIDQLEFYHTKIIAKTPSGLYLYNNLLQPIRNLQSEFGFSGRGIIDFAIQTNTIWVSHSGGVQALDLNYSQSQKKVPALEIRSFVVNEKTLPASSGIKLKSNESKLEFELLLPTLRHRANITYFYKLNNQTQGDKNFTSASNRIVFDALAAGSYTVVFKALINGNFTNEIEFSFQILKPFYMRPWFIILSLTVFMLGVYTIYRRRLAKQNEALRLINELNASKLTAIQSQMNPHFMFNALNSIQDLVLKGDVENSYSYITTFSNMVRRTLDYSDKDFIDFEKEIALLELYLSLEKLRFKSDFEYRIDIGNVEDILLPPMIIQPFVENALVHGLLHKTDAKKLSITFSLDSRLTCVIEDNGLGRKHSAAIKERKQAGHQSFSGKAIKKRFDILSEVYEGAFGYRYEDLQENEKPSGTKVYLSIPFKRKY